MTGDDMWTVAGAVLIGLVVTAAWRTLIARLTELARVPRALDQMRDTMNAAIAEWHQHHLDHEARLSEHEARLSHLENQEHRP